MSKQCENFDLHELVSEPVLKKYGEQAWSFFDPRLLETIDWIRDAIDRSITINNWYWKGNLSQRGLRENTCKIVKDKTNENKIYLSAHVLGAAVDFDVEGMTSSEVRFWIDANKDKLPYNIRIESNVGWVHLDVIDTGKKITYFNA